MSGIKRNKALFAMQDYFDTANPLVSVNMARSWALLPIDQLPAFFELALAYIQEVAEMHASDCRGGMEYHRKTALKLNDVITGG